MLGAGGPVLDDVLSRNAHQRPFRSLTDRGERREGTPTRKVILSRPHRHCSRSTLFKMPPDNDNQATSVGIQAQWHGLTTLSQSIVIY